MTGPFEPTERALRKVREQSERRLSAEELDAWINAPMSDAEREEILSLYRWFTRRYPTVADRLAYARRAYARWAAAMPKPK